MCTIPASLKKPRHTDRILQRIGDTAIVFFMVALLILCLLYHDKITADEIVRLTPGNQAAAALLMLILFGIKSFCVFIYCGILYAACGMIFSFPMAMAVNILGTAVMTTIPYLLARKAGNRHLDKLLKKHPKMMWLKEAQSENSFFVSFIIRLIGLLPSDLVSAFFGAGAMHYGKYLLSSILGFLPMMLAFTVMGMSVRDVTSPAFLTALGAELCITLISCVFYAIMRKKKHPSDGSAPSITPNDKNGGPVL